MSDRICLVPNCVSPHYAKDLCRPHYDAERQRARPSTKPSVEEAFWKRVAPQSDGCWHWRGSRNNDGYGRIQINYVHWGAHRLAYTLLVGAIPDDLVLDHLCRVRHCVNPEHLEPVTVKVNILRGEAPPAVNARKTHCANGHPFDAVWGGARSCRRCKTDRKHEWERTEEGREWIRRYQREHPRIRRAG